MSPFFVLPMDHQRRLANGEDLGLLVIVDAMCAPIATVRDNGLLSPRERSELAMAIVSLLSEQKPPAGPETAKETNLGASVDGGL